MSFDDSVRRFSCKIVHKAPLLALSIPKATKVKRNFWGFRMEAVTERRREQRLRYHWPVWFAEDFNEMLLQGQMVDVSSGGAAFTYYADEKLS